jgi:4-aminobutyrate aminotransferase/(S)-3-amino-2-methylpropionate transaminase
MAFESASLVPVTTKPIETRWRRIQTAIPAPESISVIEQLRGVEARSMAGMPQILWDQAEGFLVRDRFGNQWIDLTSGIVLANAGHAHPAICNAVRDAAAGKLTATYAFPQERRGKLLERLVALSPVENAKAILFSAGTEATECAMMLMRRHGQAMHKQKIGIVSFADGYHGRTLGASLAMGQADWLGDHSLPFYQIPFPYGPRWPWGTLADDPDGVQAFQKCIAQLETAGVTPDSIAGFIGEPVPGWATWPIPEGFAHCLRDWCHAHDILLCYDEIQCGMGRTGKWFGFEHTGTVPDLYTLGKGLTSTVPVSAVVGRGDVLDLPNPGEMSSTHGGNPICAAAALACIDVIESEDLVRASADTGAMILDKFHEFQAECPSRIFSVHGPGLFISMHFKQADSKEPDTELADAVAHEAVRRGVLMFVTGRGFIKFTPPLSIDPEAALEAAAVICECVRDLS